MQNWHEIANRGVSPHHPIAKEFLLYMYGIFQPLKNKINRYSRLNTKIRNSPVSMVRLVDSFDDCENSLLIPDNEDDYYLWLVMTSKYIDDSDSLRDKTMYLTLQDFTNKTHLTSKLNLWGELTGCKKEVATILVNLGLEQPLIAE